MSARTADLSGAILDEAGASMGPFRGLDWLGDAAITAHMFAILPRQIQIRLPDAVVDARDQEYSWVEIGDLRGRVSTSGGMQATSQLLRARRAGPAGGRMPARKPRCRRRSRRL